MNDHIPLEDLSARIDDALAPARRDQVDAHLASCPECSAQIESLQWSVAFTRAMPQTPLPLGASLRVPVYEAAPPVWRRWLDGGPIAWAGAAAAIVVAVGIAALAARGMATSGGGFSEEYDAVAMLAEHEPPVEPGGSVQDRALRDESMGGSYEAADRSLGYPEPLFTARAARERDLGYYVPPPEIAIEQPEPDTTALALEALSRRVLARADEALSSPETAAGSSSEAGDRAPAPRRGAKPESEDDAKPAIGDDDVTIAIGDDVTIAIGDAVDADEQEAADPEQAWRSGPPPPEIGGAVDVVDKAEAPVPKSEGSVASTPSAVERSPSLPLAPVAALAGVLLALSALLYVRTRR